MKTVLNYKAEGDTFIIYKNETIYVEKDGVSKTYKSIKEYEDERGYILEELFPSNLVLFAKRELKWKLYQLGENFYEVLPYKSIVYSLGVNERVKVKLPKGAKEVAWSQHPYRFLL